MFNLITVLFYLRFKDKKKSKKSLETKKSIKPIQHLRIDKRKILETSQARHHCEVKNQTSLVIKRRNVETKAVHEEGIKKPAISNSFLNEKKVNTLGEKNKKTKTFDKEAFDKKLDLLLGERIDFRLY